MDLLANDLSVHEQFHDITTFRNALSRLMAMHRAARRFGRQIYCHRALLTARPIPGVSMQHAIGRLGVEQRRDAMLWLTRAGPFWDDVRQHGADDYLAFRDDVVTDTAVGEAAFRTFHGTRCGLVSVSPSDWDFTPVEVIWRREAEGLNDRRTSLENWRDAETLGSGLRDLAPSIQSWEELRKASTTRFDSLTFAVNSFAPLEGIPFSKSAADRYLFLFGILDRLARTYDAAGKRTAEGHRIYKDHFTGETALFSDSSDSEKARFHRELTFSHPDEPDNTLFCTWHGKIRHMTLRLHFSWPIKWQECHTEILSTLGVALRGWRLRGGCLRGRCSFVTTLVITVFQILP